MHTTEPPTRTPASACTLFWLSPNSLSLSLHTNLANRNGREPFRQHCMSRGLVVPLVHSRPQALPGLILRDGLILVRGAADVRNCLAPFPYSRHPCLPPIFDPAFCAPNLDLIAHLPNKTPLRVTTRRLAALSARITICLHVSAPRSHLKNLAHHVILLQYLLPYFIYIWTYYFLRHTFISGIVTYYKYTFYCQHTIPFIVTYFFMLIY